jgi:hypothetical protein
MNRMKRKQNPLHELIHVQQEEVAKYKWIESEKAGQDIGWERAYAEWLEKHFPNWERYQKCRAIDEGLRASVPRLSDRLGRN